MSQSLSGAHVIWADVAGAEALRSLIRSIKGWRPWGLEDREFCVSLCVCVRVCVLSAHMPCKNPSKHGSQAKSVLSPIATRHLTLAQADHVAGAKLGLVVVAVVSVMAVVVVSGTE